VSDLLLVDQAVPTGAVWSRGDLVERIVRALDLAVTVLDEFGTTGFTDTERPALSFGPDKVIAESAMLAYAAAGATDDPLLATAVDAVVARLLPLCRSPRALADAALQPQRAFKYAIPHLLVTALGHPDERFDTFISAQCALALGMAADLEPVARMERQWVMTTWEAQAAVAPGGTRLDLRGTALERPLDVLTTAREDAYALTHMLFYVSDFARRSCPALSRARTSVLADVRSLLVRYVRLEDYDLAGELLMAWPELRAEWDPVSAFCFRVLADVEDRAGLLPCGNVDRDRAAGLNPAESRRYLTATAYHTAFVMGFCCAAALRVGPPPLRLPQSSPTEVWQELYELVDHRRGHWQPVFSALTDAERSSLAPMLADMAIVDAMERRDYASCATVLSLAARGGVDGPLQRRARSVLGALSRAVELAADAG